MSDLPKTPINQNLKHIKIQKNYYLNNLADIVKLEIDTNNLEIAQHLIDKKFQFVLILDSFHNQ